MTARRHVLLLLLTVALVGLGVGLFDLPISRWFKHYVGIRLVLVTTGYYYDGGAVRDVLEFITQFGVSHYYLAVSFALFAWFWLAARRRPESGAADLRRAHQAIFVFATVAATLPVSLLKMLIGRARPRLLFRDEIYGFWPFRLDYDYWSLPSGHTATAVAVALAFYFLWPRYWGFYLGAALLVAASRIVITTHYFADVVAGAYVAFVGALVVRHLFEHRARGIFGARPAES